MAAVLFLMVDVGNPLKMILIPWYLRNLTSIFFYTSLTYYLFGLLLLMELYYTVKITRGSTNKRDRKMAKWLAIIAVPFALWVLHAPHGAIFAFIKAREYWHTPLLPPHFAAAALVTGTALMILVAIVTSNIKMRALVSEETLGHMGKLLAFFIAVTLFFDFFDILVLKYTETLSEIEVWSLLAGRYAPLFALNIGGLLVALLILLFKQGRTTKGLTIASVLAIAGIAAYRYNLTVVGLLVPLLPALPEIHYSPTVVETLLTVGLIALAILLYVVLTRILPMEERPTWGFPIKSLIERTQKSG